MSDPSNHGFSESDFQRALVQTLPDGIAMTDREGRLLFISPRLAQMHGYDDPADLLHRHFLEMIAPESRDRALAGLQEIMATGGTRDLDLTLIRQGGQTFTGSINASLIHDETGGPSGLIVTIRDITERKRIEDELRNSVEMHRTLFESAVEGILVARIEDRKFVYANPAICSLLGYREDELIGMKVDDIHPPGSHDEVFAHFESQARRELYDAPGLPCLRRDGSIIYADVRSSPAMIDGELCLIGFFTDVTERRRAEAALRESQVRLEAAIESIPFDVFIIGEDGRYAMANSHCRRHWGEMTTSDGRRQLGDIVGKRPEDLNTDSKYREIWAENNRRAFAGEVVTGEVRYRLGDEDHYFYNIISPVMDQGRVREIIGINIDVTERRRAEDALAAEKELSAVTLASIGDGVISADVGGRIVLINREAAALTGWSQDEALGLPVEEVFIIASERSGEPLRNVIEEIMGREGPGGTAVDAVLVGRDGSRRVVAASGSPIQDQENRIVGSVLAFRDVTDKRRTESELFKSQKLESLALLAGGIAHDFNNILTAILGNISIARMHSAGNDKVDRRLGEAEKACARARDLTQQLLTFTRSGAPIKTTASLRELIEDSAGFVVRGSNVRIEFDFDPELWPVRVDPSQISQVIHNLILNADQAMDQGGLIRVKAENLVIDHPREAGEFTGLADGPYARITVTDQGIGIPREHFEKLYDPFFTTKPRGSGLGLAITYSIVKRHEGGLEVNSTPGQGTAFTVLIPASPDETIKETSPSRLKVSGKGRVLVMDDESAIREILELMLADLGYEAALADNGEQAIERYRQAINEGRPFDAVILDLTVPGAMGGRETLARLLEIDPRVKAIVSSGYSTDPVMADFEKYGFSGVVAKPYDLEGLSQALGLTLGHD